VLPREAPLGHRPARPAPRPLTRRAAAASLAAAVLLVAGCGDDDSGDGGTEPPAADELSVTLDPDGPGGEPRRTAELACSGSEPGCEQLDAISVADFDPVEPGTACTEIYGGPDVAEVSGTIDGEPVQTELTRADGCQIERFDRFAPLLRELFPGYAPGQSLTP
jgi:hypothetical protein